MAQRDDGTGHARRTPWRHAAAAIATLCAVVCLAAPHAAAQDAPPPASASGTPAATTQEPITPAQPGYDGIRAAQDGRLVTYTLWVNLPPVLVTTPDGGAWAFFT